VKAGAAADFLQQCRPLSAAQLRQSRLDASQLDTSKPGIFNVIQGGELG
jgi:hypothetical protein